MKAEGYLKLKSGVDIRGCVVESEEHRAILTPEAAKKIGYAFAQLLAKKQNTTTDTLLIAVGHDARESSFDLAQAFIHGLTSADCDVQDCGLCPTPAMIRASVYGDVDGSAMVTASHHAWYENGFKLAARGGALAEKEIEEILVAAQEANPVVRLVKPCDMNSRYLEGLRALVKQRLDTDVQCPLLGLHVIVDAGGGAGGLFAKFLEEMGCEVTGSMGLEPDAHRPRDDMPFDSEEALKAVSQAVVLNTADMGIVLDADGDRAVFVDGQGRIISGNRLIALICAVLLDEDPGATIVTDSVTSSGLQRFITEWGGVHYRYKRGYQNVIREAVRLNEEGIDCPLAIETSGHAAFRENHFIGDGLYLATRLLCEALLRKRNGGTIGSLIEELNESVEHTEIRLRILADDYRQAAQSTIETILSHTLEDASWHLAKDNREGVRILFDREGGVDNAWFQLRLSVHDPVLSLCAESDVPGGIRHMFSQLYELIQDDGEGVIDLLPLRKALEKPC